MKKRKRRKDGAGQQLGSVSFDDGDAAALEGGDEGAGAADDRDGVPLDVQIPGVATARTEDSGTEDGTAASSEAASGAGAGGRPAPATAADSDGETSITSTDDIMEAEEMGDGLDTSALSNSSEPESDGRPTLDADTIPGTPPLHGEKPLMTPPRSRATPDSQPAAASELDITPRASGHLAVPQMSDGAPSRPHPLASTRPLSTGSLPDLAGRGNRSSSAIGDDTAMLRMMVPLPSLRPVAKSKSFVIPEDEAVEDGKREIANAGSGEDGDGDANDLSLHIPIPLIKRGSFASAASEYTCDDGSTITGDNVCPICLSGFRIGDLLVTSKYCSHVFHKVRCAA
jgi:hypothetical protein